ncbi:MAG: hypothetical protein JKY65_00750 [Planctomycetes bacterium]|nr:hypothetical protein [Planctomycetota bacterium]
MRPTPRATPSPLASPAASPAVSPGATRVRTPGAPVGIVLRVFGPGARVRSVGSAWSPLALDQVLGAGDEVDLGRAAVEILLTEASERPAVELETRLALAPGARATLGPLDQSALVALHSGACFATVALVPLEFVAGACRGTIRPGAAALEVDRRGGVKLEVHAGGASLEGPGGKQSLKSSQRGGHSAKGKLIRPRAFAPQTPRWLARLQRLDPRRVLFKESFAGDVAARYEEHASTDRSLRFGNSTPRGGLYRHLPGARVRVRVRLTESGEVAIKLTNLTQKDNFKAASPELKAGVWVVLELRPERFVDAARAGKSVASGDLFGYLDLSVRRGKLEVAEVVAYQPGE